MKNNKQSKPVNESARRAISGMIDSIIDKNYNGANKYLDKAIQIKLANKIKKEKDTKIFDHE